MQLWVSMNDWFKMLGLKIDHDFLRRELTSHPDYPKLSSLSDFLNLGGLHHFAIKTDASKVSGFRFPLLAHIKNGSSEFVIPIPSREEWDKNELVQKHWTGLIVFTDQKSKWKHVENTKIFIEKKKNNILNYSLLSLLAVPLFFYLLNSSFYISVWATLSFFGIITSLLVIKIDLGFEDQFTKQICGLVSHSGSGCKSVLKTKFSRGIYGLTLGQISIIYFVTTFSLVLFSSMRPSLLQILFPVSIASIAIAISSLVIQKFYIKQWCGLCLIITGLLLSQGVLSLILISQFPLVTDILIFVLTFIFLSIVSYLIVALLQEQNKSKGVKKRLDRWTGSVFVFKYLLSNTLKVDRHDIKNEIVFGNPDSKVRITVACQPYCQPCAESHEILDKLLDNFKNHISITYRFLSNNNLTDEDGITKAVVRILSALDATENPKIKQQILNDWFAFQNLEKFNAKWEVSETNFESVKERLKFYQNWFSSAKITVTPTVFINEQRLPGLYYIKDLENLIPGFIKSEEKQVLYNVQTTAN